ncbi:hypothetical protein HELRODRAFT_171436 [Helobdella robusta]|uniref:Endonuclease/exonuclease/phosphatase domain-containing protein n=1 Tax=Helobdella robusta TaxID=6412 RepID=T1F4A0_HELRO|nr:hypothetical protein HELRODRAFT_171436 [Helobdella robusta]ESO05767.1 hypothetical protein HELRODRAFT_171436 [Helobdella robusta]
MASLIIENIVVAGDFNIHVETSSDIYATALADIFSSFDLVNRINQSTHVLGGTLDLIVTSDGFLLEDILVYSSGIYSDHGLVTGQFLINPTPVIFKKSWIRSRKQVDKKRLTELLRCSPISKHYVAPLHEVRWKHVPTAPWFDSDCKKAKQMCRKKRRFRTTGCYNDKVDWVLAMKQKNVSYSV